MLTAVILEDEIPASERLCLLLSECQVTVLETFRNGTSALNWFAHQQADVVFVDINLPGMDGLEFVDQLSRLALKVPTVIFTTAHDEHALRAFDLAAMDYLLKPIKLVRLKNALERIPQSDQPDAIDRVSVRARYQVQPIPLQKVAYLLADEKVVWLYTHDGQVFELSNALIYWEKKLGDKAVRVHRNALVMRHALQALVRLESSDNGEHWGAKIINSETVLPVSRRNVTPLIKLLELG